MSNKPSLSKQRYLNLKALASDNIDLGAIKPITVLSFENLTCAPKTPPNLCRVRPTKGRTNEGTIYGRTDHSNYQGTGIW